MNAVDIQDRRRLVFKYQCLGLSPQEMHKLITDTYPVSIETVRRDLREIDTWLPSLLSLEEGTVEGSLYRLIGHIHLARKRLLQIMYESNNDAVVTGAAKGVGLLADREAQLLMDTGMFTRAALKVDAGPTHLILETWRPEYAAKFEKECIDTIAENYMDSEARRLRRNDDEDEDPPHPDPDAMQEDTEQAKKSPHVGDDRTPDPGVNSLPHSVDTSQGGQRIGGYVVRKK